MILLIALAASAAIAFGVALYKHKTLAAVEASAKKEAANVKTAILAEVSKLEVLGTRLEADAKADYSAALTRLKALGL
jgi:hypothetical protein